MKKLLSILGATGLVATTSATVVSCGENNQKTALDEALDNLENLINSYMQIITNDMKSDDLKKEALSYLLLISTKTVNIPVGQELKWTNLLSKALDAKMAEIIMQDENCWKSADIEDHKKEFGKFDLVSTISLGYDTLFDYKHVDTLDLEQALEKAAKDLSEIHDDDYYHHEAQDLQLLINELRN
ncbi:hypothetical protein JN01_0532 [Entomoplasma freundtii]|uniref:Uncharacterized protein n=1 Tax=Entomoplasma freundtii TaxID=74700 RepID=A0A2K8NS98_9MOLU|nr:lipoprotein [Entomoplasma freundtii]ATZ16426.1 hypothetical protein EFREU_v1c04000 [Entomoplasma freundtii]TDY56535.1 hypothetical protein JN01_0532 [Entomoplasma freundtii]